MGHTRFRLALVDCRYSGSLLGTDARYRYVHSQVQVTFELFLFCRIIPNSPTQRILLSSNSVDFCSFEKIDVGGKQEKEKNTYMIEEQGEEVFGPTMSYT